MVTNWIVSTDLNIWWEYICELEQAVNDIYCYDNIAHMYSSTAKSP